MKIITGGQTGVDRAALDVALKHGIDCGGWCPAGRRDELGRIPDHYPVTELPGGGFEERTRANVRDSQGSVLFYDRELGGGTKFALQCCRELNRPYLLIDGATTSESEAAQTIVDFIRQHRVAVLGIGGPRLTDWPGGYAYAYAVLEQSLGRL